MPFIMWLVPFGSDVSVVLDHLVLSHSSFDQLDPKCSGMLFFSSVSCLILNDNLSNISV